MNIIGMVDTAATVVFDVGETLVDETRAWSEAADAVGVTRLTLFAALGALIERGDHHSRVWALLGVDPPPRAAEIRADDLYPDAVPCLEALAVAGLRIGLAGNQPQCAEAALARLGLPVDFIAASARWGVEKPDPAFFARVAEEAGVAPLGIRPCVRAGRRIGGDPAAGRAGAVYRHRPMNTADLDRLIAERRRELRRPILVALDGRSGAGKSTLAAALAQRHKGAAIAADDFWAGVPDEVMRTLSPAERWSRAIDWRRLRREVLEPLLAGQAASWRTFAWESLFEGASGRTHTCDPVPVIVLDGVYSARPELRDLVDVAVLVTLDDRVRRSRLRDREGREFMRGWHRMWDEAEGHYFDIVLVDRGFDVQLTLG
jgi:uridine kinase